MKNYLQIQLSSSRYTGAHTAQGHSRSRARFCRTVNANELPCQLQSAFEDFYMPRRREISAITDQWKESAPVGVFGCQTASKRSIHLAFCITARQISDVR